MLGEPDGFHAFVASRSPALIRSARLLTGNEASAQDLVQTALAKTWSHWSTLVRQDAPEAYVRRVMVSTYLTWNRRRWRGEHPVEQVPDVADTRDDFAVADLRRTVEAVLQTLPRRQRVVIVLRYLDDLTELATADLMGCSVGTIKSQTAKAFATLRADPQIRNLLDDEVARDAH
jgi:RNA polymerase sigma-70 factor (sigma-E family)